MPKSYSYILYFAVQNAPPEASMVKNNARQIRSVEALIETEIPEITNVSQHFFYI